MCAPEEALAIAVETRRRVWWVGEVCAENASAPIFYDQHVAASFSAILVALLVQSSEAHTILLQAIRQTPVIHKLQPGWHQ